MRKLSDLLIVMIQYVQQSGYANPHWPGMCHHAISARTDGVITQDEHMLIRWHLKKVLQEQAPDGYCPSYTDLLLERVLYEKHPMDNLVGWYNWYIWMCYDLRKQGL